MKRLVLAVTGLCAVGAVAGPEAAAQDSNLERLVHAYWGAASDAGEETALSSLVESGAPFDSVYGYLRRGRPYRPDVETGRIERIRYGSDGKRHPYFFVVPDDYDPKQKYPVRFYLHGGVARAAWDSGGRWWRRREGLTGSDYIAVFPASWIESTWWQQSQVENLEAILNAIKRDYNVDEDRVSMFGVSDGGTGVYFFAARAPTPWSAFVPLIGFPGVLGNPSVGVDGEIFAPNFASRPLYVVNGETDRLYPARLARPYMELFEALGADVSFHAKPAGHTVQWWPEEQPAIDRFLATRSRDPLPNRIVWHTERTDRYNRFSWVRIDELGSAAGEINPPDSLPRDPFPHDKPSGWLSAERDGQRIVVRAGGVRRYTLLLSPNEIDFSQPVEIETNGESSFHGTVQPELETLLRWAHADRDRSMLFGAELEIVVR